MSIKLDGTNDHVDLGTLNHFGSSVTSGSGFTFSLWCKTSQQSAGAFLPVFSQNSATPNAQSLWWMMNTGYTTGPVNSPNSILINLGDLVDGGFLWHQVVTGSAPDMNDGQWHHHAISVKVSGAAQHQISYYLDGQPYNSWTKPFDDALGTVVNYTSTVPLGARKITTGGGTYFDWINAEFEDARIYLTILSASEISEIYQQRGGDSVRRQLLRRYPLNFDATDLSTYNTACVPKSGSYFTTGSFISSYRRRSG